MKRVLALLTAIVLSIGLLPSFASAAGGAKEEVPFETRHPKAAELWQTIEQVEREQVVNNGNSYAKASEAIYAVVASSPETKPGSIERHGDAFFWDTVDGAACGYNPTFRERVNKTVGSIGEIMTSEPSVTVEGSVADSENVAVFQPYYGLDSSFTAQYATEGKAIANVLGGTCTTYRTTNATIDNIAHALETCAVVIFDSHGDTDYSSGDDCTSKANTSYLCLQTGDGFTAEDMQYVEGTYGRYKHAFYAGAGSNGIKYYLTDGTAIANHMSEHAPDSLLWMAICLGMATDGLHAPLREMGVQTVYGYSQSVSFGGDYKYEESFFYAMKQGATVMSAISFMKRERGSWDPTVAASSVAQAASLLAAFPIVVSDEDVYPGHGNVDTLQTVVGKGRITEKALLYGDVNGDGRIGVTDASLLMRYIAKTSSLSRDQLLRADVNADCGVNAQDASELLRRIVGHIDRFSVEP